MHGLVGVITIWEGDLPSDAVWRVLSAWSWLVAPAGLLLFLLWRCQPALRVHQAERGRKALSAIGLANSITICRGLLICSLGGFVYPFQLGGFLAWVPAAIYASASLADGLDGWIARAYSEASPEGEVLDREVDGLGTLVAAALCCQSGRLPAFYLPVGGAYYLFSLAIWLWKRHGKPIHPLRPSRFRKGVGVLQTLFLAMFLAPLFSPAQGLWAAIALTLAVAFSFARDWMVVTGNRVWVRQAKNVERQNLNLAEKGIPCYNPAKHTAADAINFTQGGVMSDVKVTKEELLEKAKKPAQDSMKMHPFYKGKIEVVPKCVIRDVNDFAIWYTPGVAEPCKEIHRDVEKVFEYTNKANMVAVVTDGTRVLGLGDIGPHAGLPVMEGKCLIFKYLGGVDAVPICLDTKDADEIIGTVKLISPAYGGINLEDIENPKCFYVLDRLRAEATIPVWHDDQQGTAAVTLAALINALKIVNKKIQDAKITMVGIGAANVCITRMMIKAGADPKNIIVVDSKGILSRKRDDIGPSHKEKLEFCKITNCEDRDGGMEEAMRGQDVVIALSKQGPDTIKKSWISQMADNAVVMACANPIPEIWPWEAKEAGARVVATGRSDFPNQVNNSIGFPGIFRGTLDVRARTITDEMCIAAAHELAKCAEDRGLSDDYIMPTMDQWEVFPREAVAVAKKAIEQGVARLKFSEKELFSMAETQIRRARDEVGLLMEKGIIPPYVE